MLEGNVKGPTHVFKTSQNSECVTVLVKTTNLLKQKFALEKPLESPWPSGQCRANRGQVDKWPGGGVRKGFFSHQNAKRKGIYGCCVRHHTTWPNL